MSATPCRSCLTARVRARRLGGWQECRRCGAQYNARELPEPVAPAPRAEPLVLDTTRPPRLPEALGLDPVKDFDLLAKWLPVIEGRAAGIEPTIRAGAVDGRSDYVDARSAEIAYALRVLDRLAALARADALVLMYTYLWTGGDIRALADGARDPFTRFHVDIGLVFARPDQRLAWLLNPSRSQGTDAAREDGRKAREQALKAYGAPGDDAPAAPIGWLSRARDEVSRRVREKVRAERELTTVRRANREGAKPSRKERRAHLQRAAKETRQ